MAGKRSPEKRQERALARDARDAVRNKARKSRQKENKEAREGVPVVVTASDLGDGPARREETTLRPTKNTRATVDRAGSSINASKVSKASKEKKPSLLAGMSEGERATVRAGWAVHQTEDNPRGGGGKSEEVTAGLPGASVQGPVGALNVDAATGLPVNRDHLNSESAIKNPDSTVHTVIGQKTEHVLGPSTNPNEPDTVRAEGPSEKYKGPPVAKKEYARKRVTVTTELVPKSDNEVALAVNKLNHQKTMDRILNEQSQTESGTHFLCPECHLLTPTAKVARTPGSMGARCRDCAGE